MYPNQFAPQRYNAVPTQYKGINFRSLLEARWAMFFDQLGWKWDFEPFDLPGYIPDFAVIINGKKKIIDIKPEEYCTERYKLSVYEKFIDYDLDVVFCSSPKILRIETMDFYIFGEEWTRMNNAPYKGLSCLFYYYNDNVFLENPVTLSDRLIYCINQSKPFKTSAITLKDCEFNDILCVDHNGCYSTAYLDITSNLIISEDENKKFIEKVEQYWKEACNKNQYKSKTPQLELLPKHQQIIETNKLQTELLITEQLPESKAIKLNKDLLSCNNYDYTILWEKFLEVIDPRTTGTLLREHGELFCIKESSVYLSISSEQLLKMARLRLLNIEQAFYDVLGYSVQVHLQVKSTDPKTNKANNADNTTFYDQVKKLIESNKLNQKYITAICRRVGIVVKIKRKHTPMSVLREQLFNLFENNPQKVITVILQNFRELLEDNTSYDQVEKLVQPTNEHNLTYNCLDNLVEYPLDYTEKTLYNLPRRKLRQIASALKINQRRNCVEISKSVMLNEIFNIYRKNPETVINAVHEKFPDLLLGDTPCTTKPHLI